MNKESSDIIGVLDDWREQGHDRLAPLRFHLIESLSRRASHQDGEARRWLDERLRCRLQAYQDEIVEPAQLAVQAESDDQVQHANDGATRPLSELLAYVASLTSDSYPNSSNTSGIARQGKSSLDPELIDYFRNIWARVSANGLLRQSRAQVPDNAGPLNSSSLAHRALTLMREQSPEYLHHFLSYLDALSWMEQLNADRIKAGAKSNVAGKRKSSKRQS